MTSEPAKNTSDWRLRMAAPLSAILTLATFAPFNQPWLLAVSLVPLLWRLRAEGVRPFRVGYGFGIVYGVGQLYWLDQLTTRWTGSPILGLAPLVLSTVLYALYFGLAGWLIHRAWSKGTPIYIPFIWAAIELFRSYIPVFAFPWGLLASPLWRYPSLVGVGHFGTIYFVGAAVVALNVLICQVACSDPRRNLTPSATFVCVAIAMSTVYWAIPASRTSMRVTVGQPGVDVAFGDPAFTETLIGKNVTDIERATAQDHSRLLVLPEGLVHAGSRFPPEVPFPLPRSFPIVFGAQRGDEPAYQSAFGYDGAWSFADKTRLVIFGEFVPGRNWIPFLDRFNLPTGDLQAGNQVRILPFRELKVGPLLCFEGLFPDLAWRQAANGADLVAVMSMDDWFMGSSAPDQLRAASIWRSIETGLPVLRAATTGYSLATDDRGRILASANLRVPAALTVDVPVSRTRMFPWWLPIFPAIACLLTVSLAIQFPRMRQSRVNAS